MFDSLARKLAHKSTHHQHHHAAIVTRGGAIVSVGYNKNGEHAEAMALRRSKTKAKLTLYSFRWAKSGRWAMAKPCAKCALLLADVKVFYTDLGGQLVRL